MNNDLIPLIIVGACFVCCSVLALVKTSYCGGCRGCRGCIRGDDEFPESSSQPFFGEIT